MRKGFNAPLKGKRRSQSNGFVESLESRMLLSTVSFVRKQSLSVGSNLQALTAADIDGDGKQDLIAANFGSHTLSVLPSSGNGTFQAQQTVNVGSSHPSFVTRGNYQRLVRHPRFKIPMAVRSIPT